MYKFLKDKSVLFVEDEIEVLKNISEFLRHFFKKVYIAPNAELAYQLFQENKIDAMLVDIELPKMNGIELIKKIRKIDKTIPIIIVSAYTKTDYLLDSIELNLDKYIVKPLTSKKINLLLEKLNSDFVDKNIIEVTDGVYLNSATSTIEFDNRVYSLTKKEFEFISILANKKVITYDEIDMLWETETPTQNAIRSFIAKLRKKLPTNIIKNRSGIGYYIDTNEVEV
jgi:DNA-binding response OmpR family regulator